MKKSFLQGRMLAGSLLLAAIFLWWLPAVGAAQVSILRTTNVEDVFRLEAADTVQQTNQYFQEKEYGQNPNKFLPRLCYFLGIVYWLVANKYRATLAYDFCKQKKKAEKKIKCKYLFSS